MTGGYGGARTWRMSKKGGLGLWSRPQSSGKEEASPALRASQQIKWTNTVYVNETSRCVSMPGTLTRRTVWEQELTGFKEGTAPEYNTYGRNQDTHLTIHSPDLLGQQAPAFYVLEKNISICEKVNKPIFSS